MKGGVNTTLITISCAKWQNFDGKLVQFIFRGQEVVMEETDTNRIRHIRGYELIASDTESARTYYHYASDEMRSITYEGKKSGII